MIPKPAELVAFAVTVFVIVVVLVGLRGCADDLLRSDPGATVPVAVLLLFGAACLAAAGYVGWTRDAALREKRRKAAENVRLLPRRRVLPPPPGAGGADPGE